MIVPSVLSILSLATLFKSTKADSPSFDVSLSSSTNASNLIAGAWLAGWHVSNATPTFGLSNVSWSKYTDLYYSFAVPTEDVRQLTLNGSDGDVLPLFVQTAHENGVNAHIAVGGWAGSVYFSSAVGSAENRTQFVKTLTNFTTQYELDGINFDWEYPNNQGIGCNIINENDTSNFLEFLQELRADSVGANLTLSAATAITPFMNSSGSPSSNVSAFAEVLDYITVMNYDIWGSWSTGVGPNAPLNDSCASTDNQQGSAVSAVAAWTKAGFPLSSIVLGVPAYGHSFSVNKTAAFESGSTTELAAYASFNSTAHHLGDSWDTDAGVDICGVVEPNGGSFDFWSLIEAGYLDSNGNSTSEYPYRFDSCSQTPYVYDADAELMISFDDAQSFAAKGQFIQNFGLAGFAMWEAGGDHGDILLDAIREAVGFESDLEDC